jgi:hypothetical protein
MIASAQPHLISENQQLHQQQNKLEQIFNLSNAENLSGYSNNATEVTKFKADQALADCSKNAATKTISM